MTYADSNFIVNLYLNTRDGGEAAKIFASEGRPRLPVTTLTRREVINAFQLSLFFSKNGSGPSVTPEQVLMAERFFLDDLAEGDFLYPISPKEDQVDLMFANLSHRHTAKNGFRTYDLIHVATALVLGCRHFWSFDLKASKLAKLEGLKIV